MMLSISSKMHIFHLYNLLWSEYSNLLPIFFNWVAWLLSFENSLYNLDTGFLVRYINLPIFPPSCGLYFHSFNSVFQIEVVSLAEVKFISFFLWTMFFFFFSIHSSLPPSLPSSLLPSLPSFFHWVFIAAPGLSLVVASGGYSSLRCAGFPLWWLLLLRSMDSRRVGLSNCGMRAQ